MNNGVRDRAGRQLEMGEAAARKRGEQPHRGSVGRDRVGRGAEGPRLKGAHAGLLERSRQIGRAGPLWQARGGEAQGLPHREEPAKRASRTTRKPAQSSTPTSRRAAVALIVRDAPLAPHSS